MVVQVHVLQIPNLLFQFPITTHRQLCFMLKGMQLFLIIEDVTSGVHRERGCP